MEEDTGVVFLRWNVAEFDSLLCRFVLSLATIVIEPESVL